MTLPEVEVVARAHALADQIVALLLDAGVLEDDADTEVAGYTADPALGLYASAPAGGTVVYGHGDPLEWPGFRGPTPEEAQAFLQEAGRVEGEALALADTARGGNSLLDPEAHYAS